MLLYLGGKTNRIKIGGQGCRTLQKNGPPTNFRVGLRYILLDHVRIPYGKPDLDISTNRRLLGSTNSCELCLSRIERREW